MWAIDLSTNLIVCNLFLQDTCRCEKHLYTNWRMFPPYVDSNSNMSNEDAAHPGGILPGIIHDMAVTCCETCKSHGLSLVSFKMDGNDQPSQKSSDSDLRESISHKTDFSFPIPGFTGQVRYANYIWIISSHAFGEFSVAEAREMICFPPNVTEREIFQIHDVRGLWANVYSFLRFAFRNANT